MKVHLLHTNDVHSQLENYFRLGAILRTLRAQLTEQGEMVLTFDIGDVLDRVRPETEVTNGAINAALMAALGYDGWVFGNNEGLTIPTKDWCHLVERSQSTVFGTNLLTLSGQRFPFFAEDAVLDMEGVRIGLFGVTAQYPYPYQTVGAIVTNPFEQADAAVARLRSQGADIVIALSHLGLWDDRKLATRVPDIDLILGGHSHHFMDSIEWIGRTAVFQTGKYAEMFGHTIIDFDPVTRTIASIQGESIRSDIQGVQDADMLHTYGTFLAEVQRQLTETIMEIETPLSVSFDAESWFPNLLADALYDAFPSDLGIVIAGTLNASLLPGRIELQHVLAACPTPTRPLLLTLTGADILSIVGKGIQPEWYDSHGHGYGFRGSVIGYLALANAEAILDQSRERPQLHSLNIGGDPIEPNRLYRVVTSEYLWLAPTFEEFKHGTDVDMKPPLVREVLLERMVDQRILESAHIRRYRIIESEGERTQ